MNFIQIQIKTLFSDVILPTKQTSGAAGYDVYSYNPGKTIVIPKNSVEFVHTGFILEIPGGYDVEIRPRSGLSTKYKVIIPNSPATIDSDYRGEILVALFNLGDSEFVIEHGMRVAQLVLRKSIHIEWKTVEELSQTERGKGGFGSTGKL